MKRILVILLFTSNLHTISFTTAAEEEEVTEQQQQQQQQYTAVDYGKPPTFAQLTQICSLENNESQYQNQSSSSEIYRLYRGVTISNITDDDDDDNSTMLPVEVDLEDYTEAKKCKCEQSYYCVRGHGDRCGVASLEYSMNNYKQPLYRVEGDSYQYYGILEGENGDENVQYEISKEDFGSYYNSSDPTQKSNNNTVYCFDLDKRTAFVRNAWPIVLLWYAGLILFLFISDSGRNVRLYFCAIVCRRKFLCRRNNNEDLVDRILRRELDLRQRMRMQSLAAVLASQRVQELDGQVRRVDDDLRRGSLDARIRVDDEVADIDFDSFRDAEEWMRDYQLVVRTRIYNPNSSNLNDDDHRSSNICSVCLDDVQIGDKVGDLPCGHVFHSECLKGVSL